MIAASTWMLVAGYIGEALGSGTSHSVTWGVISTLGYLYILHSVWLGEVAQLAQSSGVESVKKGSKSLSLVCTSRLGYLPNWLHVWMEAG